MCSSDLRYYGVGYFVGPEATTTTTPVSGATGWGLTGAAIPGGAWTNQGNAMRLDSTYVTVTGNGDSAQWTSFGILSLSSAPPNDPTLAVAGIEVRLNGISFNGTGITLNDNAADGLSVGGTASFAGGAGAIGVGPCPSL